MDGGGRFGCFGGQFVPETLMAALQELEQTYYTAWEDASFQAHYREALRTYVGRPSMLYRAEKLSRKLGGATIYLKREDLNHTGAHKINNALGQALLCDGRRPGPGDHGGAPGRARCGGRRYY